MSAKIVAAEGDDESSALILYVAGSHYYAVDVFVGKVHYALKGPFRRGESDRVPYLGIKQRSLVLFGRKVGVVVGRGRGRDAAVPQIEIKTAGKAGKRSECDRKKQLFHSVLSRVLSD